MRHRLLPLPCVCKAEWRCPPLTDPFLQHAVRREPDRVFDPFAFEILIDFGIGEAGVGAEIEARDLASIARHNRLQDVRPAVGTVNVPRSQRAAFQVAILVEDEQRTDLRCSRSCDHRGCGQLTVSN